MPALDGPPTTAPSHPSLILATKTCRASTVPNPCLPLPDQLHGTTGRYVITTLSFAPIGPGACHSCRVLGWGLEGPVLRTWPKWTSLASCLSVLPLSAEPRCRALATCHISINMWARCTTPRPTAAVRPISLPLRQREALGNLIVLRAHRLATSVTRPSSTPPR